MVTSKINTDDLVAALGTMSTDERQAFVKSIQKARDAKRSSNPTMSREEWDEMRSELDSQVDAGELDIGQDTPPLRAYELGQGQPIIKGKFASMDSSVASVATGVSDKPKGSASCFAKLCRYMKVKVPDSFTSVRDLDPVDMKRLASYDGVSIAFAYYKFDDPRNHVAAVSVSKSALLVFDALADHDSVFDATYGVTSPQEFFNKSNKFCNVKFYADMSDITPGDSVTAVGGYTEAASQQVPSVHHDAPFGSDVRFRAGQNFPRPPESVVDETSLPGSNNVSNGVRRSARRVVKGLSTYEDSGVSKRSYNTSGITLFNNVDELYLNTISREYAQEIIEHFFELCRLPTDQPNAMQYAEDLLWAFLVARTASNKADYNAVYDVPIKGSAVIQLDFAKLSLALAEKYGLTRRNFARGVANDLRAYLMRPENQFVKSRSAQRIGADPQYGALCFDGSTGCTNVTTSEASFCRILEGRNLYERDDVIAEGASEKLFQGLHGGVRSIVPR